MKKHLQSVLTLCLTLVFLLTLMPGVRAAEIVDSGKCGAEGDNLTWTLDSNGKLTISGRGDMENYEKAVLAMINDDPNNTVVLLGAPWHEYKDSISSIVVEDGITGIGIRTFCYCTAAKTVSLPDTLQEIRDEAFFRSGVTEATIPGSVECIGDSAFGSCTSLSRVSFQDGVQRIGQWAFTGTRLETIHIPKSVIEIYDGAFQDNDLLGSVTVDQANSVYHSINNCLIETVGKRLILGSSDGVIPTDGSVQEIGRWAYNNCDSLTSITIPNTVTRIGYAAFYSCKNLVKVSIPKSVQSIDDWAFNYCTALTEITVPMGVTRVSMGMFDHCSSLKHVQLPATINSIAENAFYACLALEELNIPSSVTEIGEDAFVACMKLTSLQIPAGVKEIQNNLFASCYELAELSLPAGISSIGFGAFYQSGIQNVYFGGSEAEWKAMEVNDGNEPLADASIHYGVNNHDLPTAIRYVPYRETIPAAYPESRFTLVNGSLPQGLSLSSDGDITGFPLELGSFSFTVEETYTGGIISHVCSMFAYTQYSRDVEANNMPGYGFVETAQSDGRIQDQHVTSREELTAQTMHCEGGFSAFRAVYLDAVPLVRDKDYQALEGSTKITISAETIGGAGGGTHTLAAEFVTGGGEHVYTVQNYTVAGIASKEVHVQVNGSLILWTDSEPYIDTNSRTMCPFRAVGEALGLTAGWDGAAREASFTDGNKTIYFPIGNNTARTSDGGTVQIDTSAVIVNGRTYAPIRYLAEFFGYTVDWDGVSRTVIIE